MLLIQDELNCKFVGDAWRAEAAAHHRIDYIPAILDEAVELLRSDPQWKFWKKPPVPDLLNAELEFVDMLHFAMSEEIANSTSPNPTEEIAIHMAIGYEEAYRNSGVEHPWPNFQKRKIALFKYLSSVLLYYDLDSVGSENAGHSEPDICDEDLDIMGILGTSTDWRAFWEIALHIGLDLKDVYSTYLGKVSLNELRVSSGDKDGVYQRNWWDGKEDNFFMMEFVRNVRANKNIEQPTRVDFKSWLKYNYGVFLSGGEGPLFQPFTPKAE